MHRFMIAAALTLAATPAIAAPPTPAQSAKAFVDGIYRPWIAALARHQDYVPPSDARLWTPEMAQLFARDQAAARRGGGTNLIDYVVLCSCQDDTGLRETSEIVSANDASAAVRVTLRFEGAETSTMILRLQKLPVGWRIADVVTTGRFGGSLRQRLHEGLDPPARGARRR